MYAFSLVKPHLLSVAGPVTKPKKVEEKCFFPYKDLQTPSALAFLGRSIRQAKKITAEVMSQDKP